MDAKSWLKKIQAFCFIFYTSDKTNSLWYDSITVSDRFQIECPVAS